MLLALCGWWLFQSPRQVSLSVPELLALSNSPAALKSSVFQRSFRPELPVSEILLPADPQVVRPLSFQSAEGREVGALFPYSGPIGRGKSLSVVLVVIDLQQVQIPGLASVGNSFQSAGVYYPKPDMFATRVWRVGQNLYVCYVRSPKPDDLDSLKTRYQQS